MKDKILIYRLGSLGDTIVSLPFFHAIAKCFPNHERVVLTNYPVASNAAPLLSVLNGSGLVHSSLRYPVGLRSIKDILALRKELVALGANTMVYLAAPRGLLACYRDFVFFKMCGFKKIIGLPWTKDLQRNRVGGDGLEEPEYLRISRCLPEFGPMQFFDPSVWDMKLTAEELEKGLKTIADFKQRPFIAINMGGKASEKDWGVKSWICLIDGISKRYKEMGLLIVGATDDLNRAQQVASIWSGTTIFACGTLSPRECGAALARSALFIGHDSGPLHLASVMGTPSIGLFGDYNKPCKWHPASRSAHIIHKMEGIDKITVPEVLDLAFRLISCSRNVIDHQVSNIVQDMAG